MDLKGRNFLTLKDFTKEEIEYLLDLSADLKKKKKEGVLTDTLKGKNIALIFEKTVQEHAVLLRRQPMIWEWALHIWTLKVPRLEKGEH